MKWEDICVRYQADVHPATYLLFLVLQNTKFIDFTNLSNSFLVKKLKTYEVCSRRPANSWLNYFLSYLLSGNGHCGGTLSKRPAAIDT
jgi:hypothetical protein